MIAQPVVLGYLATRPDELRGLFERNLPGDWSLLSATPGTIGELIGRVDYLLVAGVTVDRKLIDSAPRLRALHKVGVGYDDIDVAALDERKLPLAICPIGSDEAVAEHAVALALAAVKNVPAMDRAVRLEGTWPKWEARKSLSQLGDRTVGIVGYGRIGRTAARFFRGFGCPVVAFTRTPPEEEGDVQIAHSLDELFERASLVSLHVPATPQTRQMIGRKQLEMLGRQGILINTARGSLVDQAAVFSMLKSGALGFAALDVMENEPPAPSVDLAAIPNLVVTPHIGGGGHDIFERKARFIIDNFLRFHNGGTMDHVVNLRRMTSSSLQEDKSEDRHSG